MSISLATIAGFFNVAAGIMLVAAFLFFFGGGVAYVSRLALLGRTDGLMYMLQGVRILFVLVIVLGVVQYVQKYPDIVMWLFAAAIIALGVYAAFTAATASDAEEKH